MIHITFSIVGDHTLGLAVDELESRLGRCDQSRDLASEKLGIQNRLVTVRLGHDLDRDGDLAVLVGNRGSLGLDEGSIIRCRNGRHL